MIFVTIGSMFPFDRLIQAMDIWAEARTGKGNGPEILAQIGDGTYEPRHMRWVRKLDRPEFGRAVARADIVVAHAGMGSVITAGEHGKPVVLLPRLLARGEHTSDHQLDTAAWLRTRSGIFIADTEQDLEARIAAALVAGAASRISATAPAEFLARIRAFAEGQGDPMTRKPRPFKRTERLP